MITFFLYENEWVCGLTNKLIECRIKAQKNKLQTLINSTDIWKNQITTAKERSFNMQGVVFMHQNPQQGSPPPIIIQPDESLNNISKGDDATLHQH
ncbi:hypothetical protein HHI36_001826 [Cryptolaemus montrouzieri]|uniref:Uncharacterized protein n=1 Tax=Cryptolaemus montrouzieri TaxID=559131 RepID=A0ABD2P9H5_9CUCU